MMTTFTSTQEGAVMGQTWGISGPTFLVLFPVLTIGLFCLALAATKVFDEPAPANTETTPLAPEAVGLLSGRRIAVLAALSDLLAQGALRISRGGGMSVTEGPNARRTPLQNALLEALHASDGRAPNAKALTRHPAVRQALDGLAEDLRRQGLLHPRAKHTARRFVPLTLVLAFAIGCLRLRDGVADGHPVGFLIVELFFLAIWMFTALSAYQQDAPTAEGSEMRNRLRTEHKENDVRLTGRRATGANLRLEPGDVALAVALFGTGALLTSFPAEAAALDVHYMSLMSGTGGGDSSGSGSGSSCSSCSSCGGGCGG